MEKVLKFKHLDLHYKFYKAEKSCWNILVLHGWGGSSESWKRIGEELCTLWYDVYIPDLPWFGKTVLHKAYSVDDYAQDVENFVIRLNISPLIVMWHSNGWRIAIRMSSNKIIQIKKLFLIWSAGIKHRPSLKKIIFEKVSKLLKKLSFLPGYTLIRKILYKIIWGHDYLNLNNDNLKKTFLTMLATDQKDEIAKIADKTVLVRWDKDTYTPVSDWKLMHTLISWSHLVVLQGEKHGIHLQNPERLFDELTKLL